VCHDVPSWECLDFSGARPRTLRSSEAFLHRPCPTANLVDRNREVIQQSYRYRAQ
jgi:hypothetical protein